MMTYTLLQLQQSLFPFITFTHYLMLDVMNRLNEVDSETVKAQSLCFYVFIRTLELMKSKKLYFEYFMLRS